MPDQSPPTSQTLPEFLATAGMLSLDDQRLIVAQALSLIQNLYVHLPLKRAMHAVDPVQSLRLLSRQLATASSPMKERQFHNQMLGIFLGLRDLHTSYVLPEYFAAYTAVLPFYLEEFFEDQNSESCQYIISKVSDSFEHKELQGAIVTYWNGIPMKRAVELNAERSAGSNPDARHARGLETMTIRPMATILPPDEEWVVIGYESGGKSSEVRIPWQICKSEAGRGIFPASSSGNAMARAFGIDFATEAVRRTKVHLFASEVMQQSKTLQTASSYGSAETVTGVDLSSTSSMPDILRFRTVDTPSGTFGYLRIHSFAPQDERQTASNFVEAFFNEVVRILALLPQNGLILDVRGNGGGIIMAGERLLQLFTPRRITPALFDFITTPAIQELIHKFEDLQVWRKSVDRAVETNATYSQGFPLTDPGEANSTGQVYQGPVVLITDALVYSTTDIFTAGFCDHAIGTILGTSGNTGAGGANVWDYAEIQPALPDVFQSLPQGTAMRVATRRATRVGLMTGVPLEDLGIVPDAIHKITRNDLFNNNVDLIAHAASFLKREKLPSLSGSIETADAQRRLTITAGNITRVDVYADSRPVLSLDVKGETTTVDLPSQTALAKALCYKALMAISSLSLEGCRYFDCSYSA
jgi:hypothetical protein